jgi:hypothetical protein
MGACQLKNTWIFGQVWLQIDQRRKRVDELLGKYGLEGVREENREYSKACARSPGTRHIP